MSSNLLKYKKAFEISQAFLNHLKISSYPIDIENVIQNEKCGKILVSDLSTYNAYLISRGAFPIFVVDAKCTYYWDKDIYIIVYNEKMPPVRIRFSLAHEVAHIVLGHLRNKAAQMNRGALDDITYYAFEGEANTFAGNFLAPPIIISEMLGDKKFDPQNISTAFHISKDAAKTYRQDDYCIWKTFKPSKCEKAILERYKKCIKKDICASCTVNLEYGQLYCHICGENTKRNIISKDLESVNDMVYYGVKLDESGCVKVCPRCENEQIDTDGNYCSICKAPIRNVCLGELVEDGYNNYSYSGACEESKNHNFAGNARYCAFCGSKTSFFDGNLLLDWQEEKKFTVDFLDDSQSAPTLKVANGNVVDDEELPF